MSDKNYIIIEGLPEDLRQEPTIKDVLDVVDRFHLEAEFCTITANEAMLDYIEDSFADSPKELCQLKYPLIKISFAKNKKEFLVKLISEELEQLRPDECWIDGFYQANMPVGDWISELLFINRLRSKEVIVIDKGHSFMGVSHEIMEHLYPSQFSLDSWGY